MLILKQAENRQKMALFSFQSGRKAVENDIPNFSAKRQKVLVFLFCQSGNKAVKIAVFCGTQSGCKAAENGTF